MPKAYCMPKNSQNSYRSGRAKPVSPRSLICTPGKAHCKRGTRRSSMGTARGMAGGVSRAQPRRQQASGMAFEDQHGAIQVLGIAAVEEAELLLAMGRIVGGIEIEQNLTALADLVAAESDELLAQQVVPVHQIAGGRRVLPAAESRLRAQRVAQFLIGDDLQHGIVAQMVRVVG